MMRACWGCGTPINDLTHKAWYGLWLCGRCKARSATTGWLPPSVTTEERQRFEQDRQWFLDDHAGVRGTA